MDGAGPGAAGCADGGAPTPPSVPTGGNYAIPDPGEGKPHAVKERPSWSGINGFMASGGEDEFALLTGLLGTANENLPEPSRPAVFHFQSANPGV